MRIVAVLKLTGSPRYGMSHIRGVEFRVLFEKKRTENTERDCRTEAAMGGRKFRLSTHRKNEERKKRRMKNEERKKQTAEPDPSPLSLVVSISLQLVTIPALIISLPLASYINGCIQSSESLYLRLSSLPLPSSWHIASRTPLTLCKLRLHQTEQASRADTIFTFRISSELKWTLSFLNQTLSAAGCPLLAEVPQFLTSVVAVRKLMMLLDSTMVCTGNPDSKFLDLVQHRALTLHGSANSSAGYIDDTSLPGVSTVRHTHCQLLLPQESRVLRCSACSTYRSTLIVQSNRLQKAKTSTSGHTSHINHRYQSLPDLVSRLSEMHHQHRILSKQNDRLKRKIAALSEVVGISLDEDSHNDLKEIVKSESTRFLDDLPAGSIQKIFWQQQVEAASLKNARNMRWHPLMIRWCLYLRHRSSSAYESLRSSGCLQLPSQRTLRDYTHYVQAGTGFSTEVDGMLMKAAKVDSCPEREKCMILLLDEMHIREDLVFDKHTGAMVGFANLGDINEHLVQFEKGLADDRPAAPQLAKTMVVFMVRSLFSKLQFPYAQFPCASLSGELLYDPFWEAVRRVENCGLKVLGATLDGNAVNRRLIKLHQPSSDLVYKVQNPFAQEKRFLFFFSDPPHLLKTIRNCWQSKHRTLENNGKSISWSHLTKLYHRDTSPGMGIQMVPKLKFEHISLTSFSKMRVDLAAQVLSETVSKGLKLTGGEEASETAHFVGMVDKFFDALNVHNYTHGIHSRKRFQMPYTSSEDMRLKWLEGDFLSYFNDWEESVRKRSELTRTQQNKLLLSAETRLGLKMTCKSFVELVRYLFTLPDVNSFLSQRICQDPLERFFGCQRQRGGVHDNPNVQEFTKNTQALRVINSMSKGPSKGNCRGGHEDTEKENSVEPLPKRPRKKLNKPLGLY